MTRQELEHAIRAACDVAKDTELYVIGSQAILGQYPEAPADLRQSAEVDVIPKNKPEAWNDIDGALGEGSPFHLTNKFWVQGVELSTAYLPEGWQQRLVRVEGKGADKAIGWCVEGEDLALAKLARFDDKDRRFVRTLMRESMVNVDELLRRLVLMRLPHDELRPRIRKWLEVTRDELAK